MFNNLVLKEQNEAGNELPTSLKLVMCSLLAIFSALIGIALFNTKKAAPELAQLALENIPNSGVTNPVTAVLLNFRSYDTLLEIVVLLIVAIALLPNNKCHYSQTTRLGQLIVLDDQLSSTPVLTALLKWLIPIAVLVGFYLLWTGAHAPGGAFQAGAIIAGAGVAMILAGHHRFVWHALSARLYLCVGLIAFLFVAGLNAWLTGLVLQYPVDLAGIFILGVEIAATISIAAILVMLFAQLKTLTEW